MVKLSVIVPVYNAEAYLDVCIRSILGQTYADLELILVDDGSPDRSGTMCDAWAKQDNRIRVIHKDNGGVCSARNAGLDAAKGEYIAFVDSDDWIEPNMYETMMEKVHVYGCDVVLCDCVKDTPGGCCSPCRCRCSGKWSQKRPIRRRDSGSPAGKRWSG